MDTLSILTAGGLKSRMNALDLLANNIANAGTAGYKADREFYNLYMSEEAAMGDGRPVSVPDVRQQWTDFSQGTMQTTGNATDLAIAGPGFFAVESANGTLLTRNGNLRVSPAGDLETSEGYKVRSTGGGTLRIDPKLAFTVGADGVVTQAGRSAGQIETVEAPDPTRLAKVAGGYFRAADVTATMRPARNADIRQGHLEAANLAAPEAAIRLVSVMRQFEMLQRAAGISAEMNKRAVEDVARVGS